jgi:glycosyltransferase involved in cell wall biosynthesis
MVPPVKVLMAPVNIAGQPIAAVRELRRQGVDATLLQYTDGRGHPFAYETDTTFDLSGRRPIEAYGEALRRTLAGGYDLYHLWMAPLFATGRDLRPMYGLDLPFLKARGKRIVYRATGFDVRLRSDHLARNPHSPFAHGYRYGVDEERQRRYLRYLRDVVDRFVVQDPELAEAIPEATIIPRAIDLERWPVVGVRPADRPLVVHAPSDTAVKGTAILRRALTDLRREGLRFDVKLLRGVRHAEAVAWYRRADIVVDQLLIGWYGVVTLEALALGKPVVVHVRDDLYRSFAPEIPVANANPATVKDVLRELIASYERRRALAERARGFVEEVHDVRLVARALRSLYAEVLEQPPRQPQTCADVDWLVWQARRLERVDVARTLRTVAARHEPTALRRARWAGHHLARRSAAAARARVGARR